MTSPQYDVLQTIYFLNSCTLSSCRYYQHSCDLEEEELSKKKMIVPSERWQDEQDAEQRRKDAMKLGDEERETILQVIIIYCDHHDHSDRCDHRNHHDHHGHPDHEDHEDPTYRL